MNWEVLSILSIVLSSYTVYLKSSEVDQLRRRIKAYEERNSNRYLLECEEMRDRYLTLKEKMEKDGFYQ